MPVARPAAEAVALAASRLHRAEAVVLAAFRPHRAAAEVRAARPILVRAAAAVRGARQTLVHAVVAVARAVRRTSVVRPPHRGSSFRPRAVARRAVSNRGLLSRVEASRDLVRPALRNLAIFNRELHSRAAANRVADLLGLVCRDRAMRAGNLASACNRATTAPRERFAMRDRRGHLRTLTGGNSLAIGCVCPMVGRCRPSGHRNSIGWAIGHPKRAATPKRAARVVRHAT